MGDTNDSLDVTHPTGAIEPWTPTGIVHPPKPVEVFPGYGP